MTLNGVPSVGTMKCFRLTRDFFIDRFCFYMYKSISLSNKLLQTKEKTNQRAIFIQLHVCVWDILKHG